MKFERDALTGPRKDVKCVGQVFWGAVPQQRRQYIKHVSLIELHKCISAANKRSLAADVVETVAMVELRGGTHKCWVNKPRLYPARTMLVTRCKSIIPTVTCLLQREKWRCTKPCFRSARGPMLGSCPFDQTLRHDTSG